jgi:glucosylceramidase
MLIWGRFRAQFVAALAAVAALAVACAGASAARRARAGPTATIVLTTANLAHALTVMPAQQFVLGKPRRLAVISVNDTVRFQRVTGFGAAMTDSAAWLMYDELTPPIFDDVMQALFGDAGIHLTFVRVPIGASDFTAAGEPYTYDDLAADDFSSALPHFSIAHDEAYIIPALQAMLSVDPNVEILASPWTAPSWMKSNDAPDNTLNLGTLLPASYQAFARYLVRFIEAYEQDGVPIDAVTPANEPQSANQFPGMQLGEPGEQTLVSQYLAPALRAAGLPVAIYGLDSGGPVLPYAQALLSGPAGPALAGVAWHCYGGMEGMSALHLQFPGTPEIVSECSPGIVPYSPAEVVIDATRNWATAVALWNLALDLSGGPVQPPNTGCTGCSGVVTISEQTHAVSYGHNYFDFGQVTRFVQPGAIRIASSRAVADFQTFGGPYGVTPGIDNVAFLNPDGTRVLIVHNSSRGRRAFAIAWRGRYLSYALSGGATATFEWP